MSRRVAKKKSVEKIRVVLYLADATFDKMESLSDTLNLHRADVLAIAVARLHSSELMRVAASRHRLKKSSSPSEEPCLAK